VEETTAAQRTAFSCDPVARSERIDSTLTVEVDIGRTDVILSRV
jgi:hypothetical protein